MPCCGRNVTFTRLLSRLVYRRATVGVGLIQDSSVTVVASMLVRCHRSTCLPPPLIIVCGLFICQVSPLMGPILGVTFGAVIRSPEMVWRSFRNEIWGILICLLVGFITGLVRRMGQSCRAW